MMAAWALLMTASLALAVACGGSDADEEAKEAAPAPQPTFEATIPDTSVVLETALESATGLEVTEVRLRDDAISISYEQVTDDSQDILLRRWLDLATIAMSFMDTPVSVTITPVVEGSPVSRVTIEAGDLASLLTGERSLRETLGRIRIEAAP